MSIPAPFTCCGATPSCPLAAVLGDLSQSEADETYTAWTGEGS